METVDEIDSAQVVLGNEDSFETQIVSNISKGNLEGDESVSQIKTEPQDPDTNAVSNEMEVDGEDPGVVEENPLSNSEISIETNEVRIVKQEPENDDIAIDKDMPIAKDPDYTKENEFATPMPTDDFLDGIATAIAPSNPIRLRVKSEFSLKENLPNEETAVDKNVNSLETDEETPPAPPPPSLCADSTLDMLAEGIATPRITLLALNRLKVKTEHPQTDNTTEEKSVLPEGFFDDLLIAKSPREAGEVSSRSSETDSDDIPPDFFDDLLTDHLKENTEQADNGVEEKYSDRLKEKERLQNAYKASMERNKRRQHKKKKSKKKSRKRSRSPIHNKTNKERNHRSISPGSYSKENKRCRRLSSSEDNEKLKRCDSLWVLKRVKREIEDTEENRTMQVPPTLENYENTEEILTPKQKRERAINRATALLDHLRNSSSNDNFITSAFQFVSTTRKLPTSHSYVQQQIYENRSPLHTIHNVSYKFNSHATRFNMEEWGLAALTTHAAKMARRIGCDAQFIYEKLKTIQIPVKLKKVKQENLEQDGEEEEELVESCSSLFRHAMTQTDDSEWNTSRKEKGYDVGVQAEPDVYSIGSQTLETQSPTKNAHIDEEAPIMNIIRDLNENQLMAIHSFAELIKEPASPNASAINMYTIQRKIMEIYKISQIPSAITTTESRVTNNYTTNYNSPGRQRQSAQQKPIIQSVKGADGTQYSINDPRMKSSVYTGRIINNCNDVNNSAMPSNADPRLSGLEREASQSSYRNFTPPLNNSRYGNAPSIQSSSTYQRYQQNDINQQLPTASGTTKRYGRGALRR